MNEKRLQAYASIAEVISAAAIVVSLLYAGYEFRRSNTITSLDADLLLYERVQEANRHVIETPGMAEILVMADTAPSRLSEADRLRFLAFQHGFFDTWEIGWYQYSEGILDDDAWGSWDAWFTSEAKLRPTFGWTENRRHFPTDAFRSHVDSVLGTR